MKINIKTIVFLLITVYLIPGAVLFFLDRHYLAFYFITSSATMVPYYMWAANKKLSCKIFGREFRF